jgi:GH24 family phage-related lysozyme (muramidase)
LTAYPDPKTKKEPYTIGWGSTRKRDGSPFRLGEKITHKEADDLLLYDIERRFLPGLKTSIPFWDELSESQRGALLSFAYNVGSNFYGHPKFETISRVLREKRWDDVPAALELYRNPGTKVEKGLHRRRLAEGSLWRTPLRHFVRRDQISTTTPNADVPLRQQQVVRDTFTKPAGVTRIVVRVTPNPASNSTKWWYLARTDGKNFWEK